MASNRKCVTPQIGSQAVNQNDRAAPTKITTGPLSSYQLLNLLVLPMPCRPEIVRADDLAAPDGH